MIRLLLRIVTVGLTLYVLVGAYVARLVRRDSLRDDPEHDLDLHALASIVMCWPHDVQTLLPKRW
ncbi:MAG: hypothetical protein JO247_13965 [Chloroflexi bacterium]|nr:hypothetical protein [Chloroflexota bacterium]